MKRAKVSEEFAKLMVILAEANGAKLTPERIEVYHELLADVPPDVLRAAIYRCCRERDQKFLPADPELRLPTVSEIRSYAVASGDDAATLAWAGFQRAAEDVGGYASLDVDDPAAAAALIQVFGGWVAFCECEDGPALAMKRQEFVAAYRQARRDLAQLTGLSRLPGACETGGTYRGGPRVWAGRLTSRGLVLPVRDRPLLESRTVAQLESGD